jgi:hypothetical protein
VRVRSGRDANPFSEMLCMGVRIPGRTPMHSPRAAFAHCMHGCIHEGELDVGRVATMKGTTAAAGTSIVKSSRESLGFIASGTSKDRIGAYRYLFA